MLHLVSNSMMKLLDHAPIILLTEKRRTMRLGGTIWAMSKSPAAYFFWVAFRESVLYSTTRWWRTKYRCSLTKLPARPSPTRNMRLLSAMEVTSGESYGLMQDGAGVKLAARSIRSTGSSSMANGGAEI